MRDTGRFAENELVAGRTIYSFHHGESPVNRPEGMDKWVLNYTVSGAGKINKGARSFTAKPGDILLFPPSVPHYYITDRDADDWVHLWVYFGRATRLAGLLNWPERQDGVRGCHISDPVLGAEIERLLCLTVETWQKTIPRKIHFCFNLLERVLLLCDSVNPLAEGGMDGRVRKAIDYLNERMSQKVRLGDVAAACDMSVSRFAHLFTEATGVPPMRYFEKVRMEKAQELLIGSNMKLAAVAETTGYGNEFYFSTVFKKLTGRAPGKFRKCLNAGQRQNSPPAGQLK